MSGSIFPAGLETGEELESTKWNPLQCNICTEQYQEPCLLRCYHSFCTECIEGKVEDGKLSCPVCSTVTMIKEGFSAPPSDMLLKFLVESSTGDKPLCDNCDRSESQMYFCNTCSQPLCATCREETHRAKMFQTHEIVPQTKHTRDIQKQCKVHGEPYILFSTEKKLMLCINCFRDMKVESRSHCVDLETAYKQGCQKLDDMMQSIRDLQNSVRDSILLLKALLDDIDLNAEKEKKDITELYNTMQEKILETKESLLKEIERQYAEKEELFKNQLVSLVTFLPTLHVHLVTCGAFSSSADKFEFLDFTHALTKRLTAIIQIQQPLHPTETSDIITEYKTNFAKCLEPLLFPPRNGPTTATPVTMATSVCSMRYEPSPTINSMAQCKSECPEKPHSQMLGNRYSQAKTKQFKMKLMETKGFFSDHCKDFDETHRELMQKVEGLKLSVQELQRDITLRRSLTKDGFIENLTEEIANAEKDLEQHSTSLEGKQTGLEQHWEDSLERIAGEQEVYQAQLQDVGRLKTEVASVNTILQKLSSFVSSIANVTQRLAPKLGQATNVLEQKGQHAALLQEISTMQPDSQHRVDAIRTAQEERDIKSANRVNPLDEELIKTKGLLRAPSARKDSSNRASMEIQEAIAAEAEREKERKKLENDGVLNSVELNEKDDGIDNDGASFTFTVEESSTECDSDGYSSLDDSVKDCSAADKATVSNESNNPCDKDSPKEINIDNFDVVADLTVSVDESRNPIGACHKSPLPDLTMELNGVCSNTSESESDMELSDKQPRESVVTNSETLNKELAGTEDSDPDTSFSSASSDDSFRQGHVREIIAKVDGWVKTGNPPESSDKPSVLDKEAELIDAAASKPNELDLSNGKDAHLTNGKEDNLEEDEGDVNAVKSESANGAVNALSDDKVVVDNVAADGANKANGAGTDEVYVAKSLPELAQVFERGELKTKKRKTKSDRNKDK